jgi:hypothetical protein
MHPTRWRAQAKRWLALARVAREDGELAWAASLTARANEYLDRAASLERAHPRSEHDAHESNALSPGEWRRHSK